MFRFMRLMPRKYAFRAEYVEKGDSNMKETKSERFRRVAEARVNKIIRMLRLLGNCAATSVYAYPSIAGNGQQVACQGILQAVG